MNTQAIKTTLLENIDNDFLDVLGYVRLNARRYNGNNYNTTHGTIGLYVYSASSGSTKVFIEGDGGMNESQATAQSNPLKEITIAANGMKVLYFTNGDYSVYIQKENLYRLDYGNSPQHKCIAGLDDLAQLNGCNRLYSVQIPYGTLNGFINGDIKTIYDISTVKIIRAQQSNIGGEITEDAPSNIYVYKTSVYGDFTKILKSSSTVAANDPFTGDKKGNPCTADVSQANAVYKILEAADTLTWKTTRDSSAYIIAFNNYPDFGNDLDAMLINQADCTDGRTTITGPDTNIFVRGNRTSSSDAAVATLKSKGYHVRVNGLVL